MRTTKAVALLCLFSSAIGIVSAADTKLRAPLSSNDNIRESSDAAEIGDRELKEIVLSLSRKIDALEEKVNSQNRIIESQELELLKKEPIDNQLHRSLEEHAGEIAFGRYDHNNNCCSHCCNQRKPSRRPTQRPTQRPTPRPTPSPVRQPTNRVDNVDLESIMNQIKIQLQGEDITIGSINVVNNLVVGSEKVITENSLKQQLKNEDIEVNRIVANEADFGGLNFRDVAVAATNSANNAKAMSVDEIKRLLENESLKVREVEITGRAIIGGREYPHRDPANAGGVGMSINDIVAELGRYTGEVSIDKLRTVDLDVMKTVVPSSDGSGSRAVDGKLILNGDPVVTRNELNSMSGGVVPSNAVVGRDERLSQDNLVRTLTGANLVVSSIRVDNDESLTTSTGEKFATQRYAANNGGTQLAQAAGSCDCSDQIRDVVDENFISGLGFLRDCPCGGGGGGGDGDGGSRFDDDFFSF